MGNKQIMPVIKQVLDYAYEKIQASDDTERDRIVVEHIASLTNEYSTLLESGRNAIDYDSAAKRFAYIYKYTIAHADYVRIIFEENLQLQDVFNRERIKVACLGGGPGSEILGMLKYLSSNGIPDQRLKTFILDRERGWADSWSDVEDKIEADISFNSAYFPFDATDHESYKTYTAYLDSDLITCCFFLSELFSVRDQASLFLIDCFSRLSTGTLVLYVDNDMFSISDWFEEMAKIASLDILVKKHKDMVFGNDEQKDDLGNFFDRFGWPKRKGKIAYILAQKV